MGYLINRSSDIITLQITIPEADVLTLDTIPFEIISGSGGNEFILVKYAAITAANNQTISYAGFTDIYLQGSGAAPVFATVQEQGFTIEPIYLLLFNINSIRPPITIGALTKRGNGVDISFRTPITVGDGDLILYIEYQILSI
jgi:hypothetical protein